MSASFEGRGEVSQRRVSLFLGAQVFLLLGIAMQSVGAPSWAVFVEFALYLTLLIAFGLDAYRKKLVGSIRADARGIRLDGVERAARAKIASAYLLSSTEPDVRVVLHRPRGLGSRSFDVRLESEEDARALLAALGLGIGEAIATFQAIYGRHRRFVAWIVASQVLPCLVAFPLLHFHLLGAHERWSWTMAGLVLPIIFLLGLTFAVRVDIGSDGILLQRFGERRYLSYAALESAELDRHAIVLSLRSGEKIVLGAGRAHAQRQSQEALAQRIEKARAAFAAGSDVASTEAFVAPGGRPIDRWLREVRALASAGDYRELRLDVERLWRLLGEGSAAPTARAGAAVALASAPDDQTRARLRVASEACADPKLRVAIERVADGAAETEIEEALASLVDAEQD